MTAAVDCVRSKLFMRMALAITIAVALIPIAALPAQAQTTFVVNSTGNAPDAVVPNGVCATTGPLVGSAPECTLRAAIQESNASPGTDTINFNIPGDGPHTIQPSTALPTITQPVVIDGYTEPGASVNTLTQGSNANLLIVLSGDGGTGVPALRISGGASTIRGLVINRFDSSFESGIRLEGSGGNSIQGNRIGTNAAGTDDLSNYVGVFISGPNNTVGGSGAGARNLISGNSGYGVRISGSGATGNSLQGNLIGTNAAGTAALYNWRGVFIDGAPSNTVGGPGAGAGNVISGNQNQGVEIEGGGATGNSLQGNLIGTNAAGTAALPNSTGVDIQAPSNTVGGTGAGAGNVISGNDGAVTIGGSGNSLQGNLIGTNAAGTAAVPNSLGVHVFGGDNAVGGLATGAGNVIAYNGSRGVGVAFGGAGNAILGNSIFSNSALGIDLNIDGFTANDAQDPDTGSNNLQNFPVVTVPGAVPSPVTGTLNSNPSSSFRIELFANSSCDPSGYGEGQTFLEAVEVTTDSNGDASFSEVLEGRQADDKISATATRLASDVPTDTSEFSLCASPPAVSDDDEDEVENGTDDCPGTAEGATVDENGCSADQRDDDKDLVLGANDDCPGTAEGATVDENGCSADQRGGRSGGRGGSRPDPQPSTNPSPEPPASNPPPAENPAPPPSCSAAARELGLNLVVGTNADDELVGTDEADLICAKRGNDEVRGGGGNDIIWLGAGDDHAIGGQGADEIRGGPGTDTVEGSSGHDVIYLGRGNDIAEGNSGNDVLYGQEGNDDLKGGPGDDQLFGGIGVNSCSGGPGSNSEHSCEP
ncbi:MAG TPA: hypothetical protein VE174_06450 [Actinomycetota bacterium]|nr:hypothetical protein [Actinomycetota bacterium]